LACTKKNIKDTKILATCEFSQHENSRNTKILATRKFSQHENSRNTKILATRNSHKMSSNLYKIEDNQSISCQQEGCDYKFRKPKNKHKSIMEHYFRRHKNIHKQLKFNTKPYSKPPLQEQKNLVFCATKSLQQQKNLENKKFDLENLNGEGHDLLIALGKTESFCFHYFVNRRYFNFKFLKIVEGYTLSFFLNNTLLDFTDEILDNFSYNFITFNNLEIFKIDDGFLLLNPNIKIVKIFYKNFLIFETNEFDTLFKN
ncbi:14391_t:CDS:1, partial [Dentiscutata heterogama]